jgi:hypothetical protein
VDDGNYLKVKKMSPEEFEEGRKRMIQAVRYIAHKCLMLLPPSPGTFETLFYGFHSMLLCYYLYIF